MQHRYKCRVVPKSVNCSIEALLPAYEHAHELAGVHRIGFTAPTAALDFDAGGVDHLVGDALAFKETVQPGRRRPVLVYL